MSKEYLFEAIDKVNSLLESVRAITLPRFLTLCDNSIKGISEVVCTYEFVLEFKFKSGININENPIYLYVDRESTFNDATKHCSKFRGIEKKACLDNKGNLVLGDGNNLWVELNNDFINGHSKEYLNDKSVQLEDIHSTGDKVSLCWMFPDDIYALKLNVDAYYESSFMELCDSIARYYCYKAYKRKK